MVQKIGRFNKNVLVATNSQGVLNFFLDHPGREFIEKEVQKAVGISKSGTNYALRELASAKFLFIYKKGNVHFYSLNYKSPAVKQLKVLKTIIYIQPILEKLERLSSKVILFGSSARGEDVADSDVDLFVISNNKREEIERQINNLRFKRRIQLLVRTELGHTELKVKDPTFYEQVQRGTILWEKE